MKYLFLALIFLSCSKVKIPSNSPVAYIISGGDRKIDVLDLSSFTLLQSINLKVNNKSFPHHIYLSKDRNYLSVAAPLYDFSKGHHGIHGKMIPGSIHLLNRKGQVETSAELEMLSHNAIYHSKNEELWTAIMSHAGRVKVFNKEGKETAAITVDADPSELIFTPDENYALVVSGEGSFLQIINTYTKEVEKKIKIDPFPENVWQGNENLVLINNKNKKSINMVSLKSFEVVDFLDLTFPPGHVAINGESDMLWVCNSKNNTVEVYKKEADWRLIQSISTDQDPHMINLLPGSQKKALVINQKGSTMQVFDTNTFELLKTVKLSHLPNGIAISFPED